MLKTAVELRGIKPSKSLKLYGKMGIDYQGFKGCFCDKRLALLQQKVSTIKLFTLFTF